MNEFQTYEVTTHQKIYGSWLVKRIVLIIAYVFYVLAAFILGFTTKITVPLLALVPVTLWMIIFFTWRYTDVDYEYSMTSGYLTFSVIYGSRTRKQIFETQIKAMTLIAPYTDDYFDKAQRYAPEVEYRALSSKNAENAYFALFENRDGKKSIFIFEADDRALSIFKFYNSTSTVTNRR
ncbi:MAG: hypothetical protein IKB02_01305 [Clostridia bacterium]|nr:hypothetical protein [Clostridia bacterium]